MAKAWYDAKVTSTPLEIQDVWLLNSCEVTDGISRCSGRECLAGCSPGKSIYLYLKGAWAHSAIDVAALNA
jgi:hypothetical protein